MIIIFSLNSDYWYSFDKGLCSFLFVIIAIGNYTYVSSEGKQAGSTAELESLTYQESGALCSINFFYYMNGTDVGMLILSVAMDNDRYPIWQRSGSQAARYATSCNLGD